jgi:hypothetical protein
MDNGGAFYYVFNGDFEIEGLCLLFLWKRKGKLAYLGYLWYNERVVTNRKKGAKICIKIQGKRYTKK